MGEVRTIFIGGLPPDCTERELHLLFYEGGYEGVKLQHPQNGANPHARSGRTTAFVQFDSRERAMAAVAFVNGMVFDPRDPNSTLRVELAKQDFRRLPTPGALGGGGGGRAAPNALALVQVGPPSAKRPRSQVHEARLSEKDAATLFCGGLGETVSQAELTDYAASQEGFVEVSMKDEGTPRAIGWAQYESPELATIALANLASIPLPSLGRAPNLEAARTGGGGGGGPRGAAPLPQTNAKFAQARLWEAAQGGGAARNGSAGSSTVFMGALEPQVSEPELQALIAPMQGFVKLTSRNLGQQRGTAWAQFDSAASASEACTALQQMSVPSMGRPANVELAKTNSRSGGGGW